MRYSANSRSPWAWVPPVYLFEGIPSAIVNTVSLIVFKDMGMPNDKLTFFTSLLAFPWILKIVLSPFIDTTGTKRKWVIGMQLLMAACTCILGIMLPTGSFSIVLVLFLITAFASSIHDIAADGFYMLGMDEHKQSLFVGVRNTVFRLGLLFGQGFLAAMAGLLQKSAGSEVGAWSYTMVGCSVIMAALALWDVLGMPKPQSDSPRVASGGSGLKDLSRLLSSFFNKEGIVAAVFFMLLYRLPEALSLKILIPFLKDARELGGLALDNTQVGLANGTVGVIALLLGGILGGIAGGKYGLRKCLIPMSLCLALPCAVYLYLSVAQPQAIWPVYVCIAADQFGYGFGFTAYTLYMLYFCRGEFRTSHYAFCTVLMTFSMMLPGLVAGKIQMSIGYTPFFILVMVSCLATFIVTFIIRKKTDPEYGRKQ